MKVHGIGIDEKTPLCIDETGHGIVIGSNSVYFLSSNGQAPEECSPGKPLSWNSNAIKIYKITGSNKGNGGFDANNWLFSGGDSFYYSVDHGVLKRAL
jgi:cyanophycinase